MRKKEYVKSVTDVCAENNDLAHIISLLNDKVKDAADYIENCYDIYNENDGSISDFGEHELFSDVVVSGSFGVPIDNTNYTPLDSIPERRGIYLFLLNDTVTLSNDKVMAWNGEIYEKKKKRGADIKKQFVGSSLKVGQCFYVGSVSSKSCTLRKRMKVHYAGDDKKTTYSLKLNNDDRIFIRDKLTVLLFPLKEEYEKQGAIFLPLVEKELHSRLRPAAGKSR
ncbi:hypothetical protein [Butyrivibrio sp. AE3004]|uniref:hypothetical protein n=1 Tax=Butyrivibrio sp. AE3004 TaxID=1506994 RepID=UPI000494CAA1|nr:hypothetical protein [Butyrivibrio sp. AE3004]